MNKVDTKYKKMKKNMMLMAIGLVVAFSTQSFVANQDDFGAYYKKLLEIHWDKKNGFDYPKTFSQIDEAFKFVREPKIDGGVSMAILRATEANNATKLAEYTKIKEGILARVDANYVSKIMELVKTNEGTPHLLILLLPRDTHFTTE